MAAVYKVPFAGDAVDEVDKVAFDAASQPLPELLKFLQVEASNPTDAPVIEKHVVAAAAVWLGDDEVVATRRKKGIQVELRCLARLARATSKPCIQFLRKRNFDQ